MKKIKTNVIIAAIVGITVVECFALMNGIDGIVLTTVVGIIAGLAGWVLPQPQLK